MLTWYLHRPARGWPQSFSNHLGEEKLKEFINFTLKYLAGEWGRAAGCM